MSSGRLFMLLLALRRARPSRCLSRVDMAASRKESSSSGAPVKTERWRPPEATAALVAR